MSVPQEGEGAGAESLSLSKGILRCGEYAYSPVGPLRVEKRLRELPRSRDQDSPIERETLCRSSWVSALGVLRESFFDT